MVTHIGRKKAFRLFIREWMKEKGVNQEQLAGRLEVESGTMSKIMNGKMRMTVERLAEIAYALDVEVDQLYRDPKTPTQDDLLAGLSDEKARVIRDMIEAYKRTG